jgi:hypothetical protein
METRTFGETTDTDARTDRPGGLSRRTALGLLGLGAVGAIASSPGRAAPDERCFTVNGGKIAGRILPPPTPESLPSTEGILRGAGPLNGSTALSIGELVPSAGLSTVPSDTVSYRGVFEIATKWGTLTLQDVGIFDSDLASDGEFTSRGRVTDGTGRWEGATGILFFWGDTDENGAFTAEANGTVCVPKS